MARMRFGRPSVGSSCSPGRDSRLAKLEVRPPGRRAGPPYDLTWLTIAPYLERARHVDQRSWLVVSESVHQPRVMGGLVFPYSRTVKTGSGATVVEVRRVFA